MEMHHYLLNVEMISKLEYDEKADVWSLGVLTYILLFGTFPYMPRKMSSLAMKQEISGNRIKPSFKPVACPGQPKGESIYLRSPSAVDFARSLMERDSEIRPSAEEALQLSWMKPPEQGGHLPEAQLPSLLPMVNAAKMVGAFENGDARDSNILSDVTLASLQTERHGQHLLQATEWPWETSSNASTGTPNSNGSGSKEILVCA